MSELSPYLVLLLVGFLPNEIWRVLGVWIGGGLAQDSEFIVWVRAVAVAVLAAVIAKLTFAPLARWQWRRWQCGWSLSEADF